MAEYVALLRDSGTPLVLVGAISIREEHPGEVTTHPVPDRTFATDGVTNKPISYTIEAIVSPNPSVQGITTGPARLQEVRAWLLRAKEAADVLSLQQPDRALAVDYVVKDYTLERGATDSERLSLTLQQLRIATSETVTLSVRQKTPVDAAVPGLAEEVDKGTTTTTPRSTSLAAALLFGGSDT